MTLAACPVSELVFYPHQSDPEIEVGVTEDNVIFRFKDSKVLGRNAWTCSHPPFTGYYGPYIPWPSSLMKTLNGRNPYKGDVK